MPNETHPSIGSTLESFLRKLGEWDDVDAAARTKVQAWIERGEVGTVTDRGFSEERREH